MKDPVALFWARHLEKSEQFLNLHSLRGSSCGHGRDDCSSRERAAGEAASGSYLMSFRIVRNRGEIGTDEGCCTAGR
jgi:hypothetical protein